MLLHQDGCTHAWVPGVQGDLMATMDNATHEHYSMFFVEEEGTASSFRGVLEVIEARGRSERLFRTHQDRLTKALALAGITGMAEANRYLKDSYPPAFTREFMPPALEDAPAFSPMWGELGG